MIKQKKLIYGGGGNLFIKLLKLKKAHQRTQILYKDFISLYPHLKYPPLESCPDYKESLKYKFHLSYLLGAALIKANKTWYKGGYIKFYFEISRLKEQFAWLKNMQDKVSFEKAQSFEYFNKHFNEIKAWIQSAKFKEKYQNHPYPPLLDPDTLDYDNIEASLAWDLNLPLPRRYGSIILGFNSSGDNLFFHHYTMGISRKSVKPARLGYMNLFDFLNQERVDCISYGLWSVNPKNLKEAQRFFSLCDAKVPVFIFTKDPLTRMRVEINHGFSKIKNRPYDIKEEVEVMVDRIHYHTISDKEDKPNLNCLDFALQARSPFGVALKAWQYDSVIKEVPNPKSIHYIEMSEIMSSKGFDTFTSLAQKFHWKIPQEQDRWLFETKVWDWYKFNFLLPITISINDNIKIIVAAFIRGVPKDKMDILPQMALDTLGLKIGFFVEEAQAKELFDDKALLKFVKEKLQKYLYALKDKIASIEQNNVKETDVLAYLRAKPELARIYKSYFDSEFTHIKAHRPDIVASWKYYQEFERMCKEMDK